MAYRALYRQYRPSRFSEVIGQAHITTTLRRQVAEGRVAHAYLLCGTRGTGKTTTARILARAVNCLAPEDGEPCGKCAACLAMADDNNGDIIELDGASNNRVDDARGLIESAQYAPLHLRRRVFIIDEVHMLTGSAFNALLKTIEEPPAHILFILATTEPHKLPATILSRCQRFDFHRLSVDDIVTTLSGVLARANAGSIEREGLLAIARAADGGMRDALSLCDRCLSGGGDTVTAAEVNAILGSMGDEFLFSMADALLSSDAPRALTMLDGIVHGGRDLTVFCQDLTAHFRALLLTRACGRCEGMLECSAEAMERYMAQAKAASEARLLLGMELLMKALSAMRYLPSPRAMLETTLLRICRPEQRLSLESLEARLDRLESMPLPAPALSPSSSPLPAPAGSTDAAGTEADAPAADADEAPWDEFSPTPTPLPAPPAADELPPLSSAPTPSPASAPAQKQTQAPAARPAPAKSSLSPTPAPAQTPAGAAASDAEGLWQQVLSSVDNIFVRMAMEKGAAMRLEDDMLIVGYPESDPLLLQSAQAPINYATTLAALKKLRPEGQLTLVKAHTQPADDASIQKAREIFGDKLTVE